MGNKSEKAKEIGKTVVKVATTVATIGTAILAAIDKKNKG